MKIKILLLVSVIALISTLAQNKDDVLAKVGDKIITVEEFKYRYEFSPQINRKYYDETKSREELLFTLIAENLMAIEAEKRGLDTVSAMKMNYVPLEKMFVRDALYQKEIADKVELDFNKLNKGFELANQKCFVDYVFTRDQKNIEEAFKLLKSSPNFDSLVTLLEDAEYVAEPYEVEYGKMYEHAEKAIFNLEINEFTEPIESPEGWYIFRLISKIPVTFNSFDQKNSLVRKVVESRAEDSIYNDFWNNFFVDKKVSTKGSLFWYLAEEIQKVIVKVKLETNIKENEKISISNEEFSKLMTKLDPDSLNQAFINFEKDPVTLKTFLIDFAFEGFFSFSTELNVIASQLSSRVKRQIELELLSRNAYNKGMESLPEVKSSTELWKEYYLSTLLKKEIYLNTELSEKDIQEFFNQQSNNSLRQTEFNIIEVLSDSLEVIKEALSFSDSLEEFREFALKHTKRELTKENGGEFGYFTANEYEEIGEIVESMEIGDVYGPLQTVEGYSVFKLIDKKENNITKNESFVDDNVRNNLKYKKIMDQLENLTIELAEKNNVSINSELLNSIDLLNTQMVVFRYMGFGGRIQAFPYSSPFYQWKQKWEQKKKEAL